MNDFLKYLEKIYKENNLQDYRVLYSLLVHNNIGNESINSNFLGWIKNYSNQTDKILVFQADNWKYFCQFIHPDSKSCDAKKMIKLYLSYEAKYIDKAVKTIFDYLAKNNIIHRSKVSSNTRNDSIVIRVNNLLDARKIVNFVNRNFFLKRYLIPVNPFVYKEHGIGMAIDGDKSYNTELAKLLFNYFEYRKNNKISVSPSINELREYIYGIYKDIDNDYVRNIYNLVVGNLDETFSENNFTDLVNSYQNNDIILLCLVKSLLSQKGQEYAVFALKQALKGNCNYLYETNDLPLSMKVLLSPQSIARIITNKVGNNNKVIGTKEIVSFLMYMSSTFNYNNEDKIKALIIALQETMKKQGKVADANNLASIILFEFIGKKDYNIITRDNNYRNFIKIVIVPSEIEEIIPYLRNKYQDFNASDYRLLVSFIENEVLIKGKNI